MGPDGGEAKTGGGLQGPDDGVELPESDADPVHLQPLRNRPAGKRNRTGGVHQFSFDVRGASDSGDDFDASEEKEGAAAVVLLSYPLWQSHFGGDHSVIGRTIALDGRAFSIIGVLPANFRWTEKTDLLEPVGVWATNNPSSHARSERGDGVVLARLAPHITFERAQVEIKILRPASRTPIPPITTSSASDCSLSATSS